jgi:hypothetical protein
MIAFLSCLLSWSPNRPPSVIIRVLRVPADGSAPHILPIQTIDASAEGNVDSFLSQVPDLRSFWGTGEGWRWRDMAQCEITDQDSVSNGLYYAWKSFADHLLPLNKYASGCGDSFIAKMMTPEYDEHGWAAYDDVPDELLDSGLYKRVIKRLSEN